MIVIMKKGASPMQVEAVIDRIELTGCKVHPSVGEETTILGVVGDVRAVNIAQIQLMEGVDRTMRVARPYKLASREFNPTDTLIRVSDVVIGGNKVVVMAGPCAVESREQMLETAHAVKAAGATMLRGGAFKPRSSPYSFQGLGEEGLQYLALAREETGLPFVTEVMEPQMVPLVSQYADMLQIGARNMQNFALLHAVGEAHMPVLLKRGLMSTIEEWLMSAEYILSHGNNQVILCERGIRTFETSTRNTLDISAVPVLKQLTHLPVMVDPSHATGKWDLVEPTARAGVAAGADGLVIEVHPHPEEALSDGPQSLKPERFAALMTSLPAIAAAIGRSM
ncbi:MAG: 3-deoxy-7-phosphoheptulonate synthase [Chloroflexi bacterium]|nr:3-deoxy-7-phosphoheptulonate synthase [Chloroflexota bacterium]